MISTLKKLNLYLLFKLPSAYLCGVRAKYLSEERCTVGVTHRWINQNPFKSMFWAVQGMAAELSTGVLVINEVKKSGKDISMLITSNKASFTKKAKGKITFSCIEGKAIGDIVEKAILTKEGQTIWLQSKGVNEEGEVVSIFDFEWSIKVKSC